MRKISFRSGRMMVAAACGCLLMLTTSSAHADAKVSPEVRAVLDKAITAVGGADAIKAVKSRVIKAKMEVVGQGVTLDLVSYQKAPNQMVAYISSPQVGEQVKGTDGTNVWQVDPQGGPRLLDGEEKTAFLREASATAELEMEKNFTKVEVGGEETLDGKPAVKLNCETPEGKKSTLYFDKASGLMVRRDSVEASPMGDLPVSTTMTDYRDVSGLKVSFSNTLKVGPATIQVTTASVDVNTEIPADKLAAPADIQKLIDEAKSGGKAKEAPKTPEVPAAPEAPAMPK